MSDVRPALERVTCQLCYGQNGEHQKDCPAADVVPSKKCCFRDCDELPVANVEWGPICETHSYRLGHETFGDVRVQNLLRALDAKQAKIDALMMEFCPGEMSKEQCDEWAKHQQPVSADLERSITESFARSPRRVESSEKSDCDLTISKAPQS